ncbi:hypothetical protein OG402_14945 [Streptomyces anulatus]|uniref:hypothetical protein n=1 Tax=Streptomyces anulatus TaxID=1892 RepID=UPI00224FC0E5|nr:hypothetical protein [Streptomyces anulatus]MCX4518897.1 hypothetical protein [Streptomyces anulatus]MCX4601778.1 hypothetical protein [Streptomyces anulatus]
MDFTPVVASVLAAFVTASVTSWAALRTTKTTWHAAHANRAFDALADLLDATDLDRHDDSRVVDYASAATRVRITTTSPLRDYADAVINSAADFNRTNPKHWRSEHPYFQILDMVHKYANEAEKLMRQYEEERDYGACMGEEPRIAARDALEKFYAQQDSGEDPDPGSVRKAIHGAEFFSSESTGVEKAIDRLLMPPAQRQALQQGFAEQQSNHTEHRAALAGAHNALAEAVAAWSSTPPARLARRLRRGN